jgi:hypothetical protein
MPRKKARKSSKRAPLKDLPVRRTQDLRGAKALITEVTVPKLGGDSR